MESRERTLETIIDEFHIFITKLDAVINPSAPRRGLQLLAIQVLEKRTDAENLAYEFIGTGTDDEYNYLTFSIPDQLTKISEKITSFLGTSKSPYYSAIDPLPTDPCPATNRYADRARFFTFDDTTATATSVADPVSILSR